MSKKEKFWNYLTVKNPKILKDPHFTSRGIKKLFDTVWDRAYNDGFYMAKELNQSYQSKSTSIFEQIFENQK